MTKPFDRRLTPARHDLAAEHLRDIIVADAYAPARLMRVIEETLPLAREPSRESPIDTQAIFGEAVRVYEVSEEGWAWGQLERDGYVGFLPAEGLSASTDAPTHGVIVPRTLVYPGPNMKLPVASALPLGASVTVARESGDFAQINGLGFVWRAHLAPFGHTEMEFVQVAEQFEGSPYLWGGKTFSGLDCSGLVQVALAACGIAAPRDTDLQERALGEAIAVTDDLAGLSRGDLVFWKGHVGIMQNETMLLHANGHHMLVVSEPLALARERIRTKTGADLTSIRRL
jgi:hypothetical protein